MYTMVLLLLMAAMLRMNTKQEVCFLQDHEMWTTRLDDNHGCGHENNGEYIYFGNQCHDYHIKPDKGDGGNRTTKDDVSSSFNGRMGGERFGWQLKVHISLMLQFL